MADHKVIPEAANPLAPSAPQPLTKPKLLVGEGKEEVFFFEAPLKHLNIAGVQLEQCRGKTKLHDYVFILPDCQQSGMLEDLCLSSVAADLAIPCVDEFMRCVENNGRRPDNIAKARVHAWLASHVVPDKRLGEAALAGYWDWNNPAFDLLKQFLTQL